MESDNLRENIKIAVSKNIDRKEFKVIVERHYEEIYIYATNLCRDKDLAKDLAQDVFFKLWEKRKKINKSVLIKGWLFKSVRNKFLDHIRKYKKEIKMVELTYMDMVDEISQDRSEELNYKFKLVEKEIELLPKKCHEVFILSKSDGMRNKEIAAYLNISVKTVEGHLTNAIKILQYKLKESAQIFILFFDKFKLIK